MTALVSLGSIVHVAGQERGDGPNDNHFLMGTKLEIMIKNVLVVAA